MQSGEAKWGGLMFGNWRSILVRTPCSTRRLVGVRGVILLVLTTLAPWVGSSASAQAGIPTPLVRVIVAPEAVEGSTVSLVGYLIVEEEGTALYLDRESYCLGIMENALFLGSGEFVPGLARYDRHYVRVTGTVDAGYRGHLSAFAASLRLAGPLRMLGSRQRSCG